jgi:hypothetical protein
LSTDVSSRPVRPIRNAREDVRLEQWAPRAAIELDLDGGFEVVVLRLNCISLNSI